MAHRAKSQQAHKGSTALQSSRRRALDSMRNIQAGPPSIRNRDRHKGASSVRASIWLNDPFRATLSLPKGSHEGAHSSRYT